MIVGGYSPEAEEKPLRPYQSYAVEWQLERLFVQRRSGCGLFLDPGLGKTRITLTLLNTLFQLGEIKRALVVAPLRPIYTVWPAEIKRWGFPLSSAILHQQHAKAMSLGTQVELINFEGLERVSELSKRWDIMVVDESTFIKNWSAKRTKYMRKMVQNIPFRVILTGTPAANSLQDLHSQLFMVDTGEALGKNVTAFRNRFCVQGGWRGHQWIVREGVRDAIVSAISDKVLTMKAKDHLDMPDLVENEIWVQMPQSASIQYKRLKRELFAQLETGEVFAASAAAAYTKCRQFANGQVYTTKEDGEREVHQSHGEKIQALCELFEELAGKPLLVFYDYRHDLARIKETSAFKNAPVLSGGMKIKDVERILAEWNAGKHTAILAQWRAASHGLNMQGCCNDIACFGVIDSLESYDQAIRRVYRQGVSGSQVRIHRLLTLGTVDEVMLERLRGKDQSQEAFFAALKNHAKGA